MKPTEYIDLLLEDNSCSYKFGNCEIFAIALAELLHKPLYVARGFYIDEFEDSEAYEDCHVVVKLNKDKYIDVDGVKSEQEIKSNCMFANEIKRIELVQVSPQEARYLFSSEEIDQKEIDKAKKIILKNKNKYKVA